MQGNVVWHCNGLMVKGDYQTAKGNLVFDKFNGPKELKSGYCALCVWRHILKSSQVIYRQQSDRKSFTKTCFYRLVKVLTATIKLHYHLGSVVDCP